MVLRVGGQLNAAECGFATEADAQVVASWEAQHGQADNQIARDAAEFGALASKRWHYYRRQDACVGSISDLRRKIAIDPGVELALMAVIKADWFPEPGVLGVCHFRRTWCNNLFVDFLTSQPEIASRSGLQVSGVGTCLLAFIVEVATEIQASAIWGETTKSSAPFYKKTLNLRRATDEFRFVRRHYQPFLSGIVSQHMPELLE